MKTTSKSVTSMKTTIQDAWNALESQIRDLANAPGTGSRGNQAADLIAKALTQSANVEREHRAMGKRWTDGRSSYRLPVELTAKYFVVKHVLDYERTPKSWLDAFLTRGDVITCYALAELLGARRLKLPRAVLDIDYATDIAG